MKDIVLTESRRPIDHRMGVQQAAFAEFHAVSHNGECANPNTFSEPRAFGDGGLRMNLSLCHFADFSA